MRKKFIVNPATNQYESVDFELNKTGSSESLSREEKPFSSIIKNLKKPMGSPGVKPKDLPNKFNTDLVKAKQNAYKTLSPKDPALAWVEYTNHKYNNEPDTPETRKRFVENAVQLNRVPMYKDFVKDTLEEITPPKEFNSVDRSTYPMNQGKQLNDWEIIESTMTPVEKRKFYTDKAKNPTMKKLMTPKELKFVDKPKPIVSSYVKPKEIEVVSPPEPNDMAPGREDVATIIKRRADERLERQRLDYANTYGVDGIASLKIPE